MFDEVTKIDDPNDPARLWLQNPNPAQLVPSPPTSPFLTAWDLGAGESAVISLAESIPGAIAILDDLAILVGLAEFGAPAVEILVEADADDLVGREEAVGDALAERVGEDRLAEIVDVGDVAGFLGRGGEADLGGR